MKRRYVSFTAVAIMFALILTTGCGVRINGKDYELFRAGDKDKINIFSGIGSESSSSQEFSEDVQDNEKFSLTSKAGNIKIQKSKDSKILVKADKKVRGASEKDKKTLLDNMNVSLERDDKVIKIVVKTKEGKDFYDWRNSQFKTYQVTINYEISVPESIKFINADTGAGNIDINDVSAALVLDTGAGNIDIDDASAAFDVDTGAGNIDIKNCSAFGDNKLSTGAGNIDFRGNIEDSDSFNVSTGAGNIKFEVPEDSKMSLDADTGVGLLSGSFIKSDEKNKLHFKGEINGGGTSVKLDTGFGNINVDKD